MSGYFEDIIVIRYELLIGFKMQPSDESDIVALSQTFNSLVLKC